MIPHHGGAILMCQQAPIRDAEIRQLCKNIITSQQTEIFPVFNEDTDESVENLAEKVLRLGAAVGLANGAMLLPPVTTEVGWEGAKGDD